MMAMMANMTPAKTWDELVGVGVTMGASLEAEGWLDGCLTGGGDWGWSGGAGASGTGEGGAWVLNCQRRSTEPTLMTVPSVSWHTLTRAPLM